MSDEQSPIPATKQVDRVLLVVALLAFLGLLAAYVGLVLAGKDPEGVVRLCVTLAGIFGLGAVQRVHANQQNAVLESARQDLGTIKQQTNGGLDKRIREGSAESMREILGEYGLSPKQDGE